MKRVLLIGLILLAASIQAVHPEAELVLRDGTIIRGADLRREGELYVVELEEGERLSLPGALVEEVRLSGEGGESAPSPGRGEAQLDADSFERESRPPEPRRVEPRVLAGTRVRPPRPSEQTRILGSPARFPKSIVDSGWTPRSDWEANRSGNDFRPSTWARSPLDPGWRPRSAFDPRVDVLESGRSRWQRSIVDPGWRPEDAFGGRRGF